MDDKRLERIEDKLDRVIDLHSNRLTKLETQNGYIQAALALIISTVIGVLTKLSVGK